MFPSYYLDYTQWKMSPVINGCLLHFGDYYTNFRQHGSRKWWFLGLAVHQKRLASTWTHSHRISPQCYSLSDYIDKLTSDTTEATSSVAVVNVCLQKRLPPTIPFPSLPLLLPPIPCLSLSHPLLQVALPPPQKQGSQGPPLANFWNSRLL